MQAVHTLPPPMLPTYSRQALASASASRNPTVTAMPTPPMATTRKRKRAANQFAVTYSEVHEVDPEGHTREVIVIDDTPPPPTTSSRAHSQSSKHSTSYQPSTLSAPVRTRAQAAKNQQHAASVGSRSSVGTTGTGATITNAAPAQKKRKRETETNAPPSAKKPVSTIQYPAATASTLPKPNWPGPSTAVAVADEAAKRALVPCDDKEGHYIIVEGDIIYERYRVVRLLGQGTFGKVVEAVDVHTQKRVAIKIIRAIPKYRDASKIEVRVLTKLKDRDPLNRHKCIHLLQTFDHRNHICLVSELYGMCIYDFLKENEFAPFPRQHIQAFARQLLGSVAFLHDLRLIHTDLKPENILLVHNDYHNVHLPVPGKRNGVTRAKKILESTEIRLIDFGSATFENEYHSTVVSTRHYRAPEIILGLGWSFPCDAFSLGCILVEFYTGVALYQTHDNLEHLAMMEAVMGKMPERFARAGARSKPEFFKDGAKLDWPKAKATRQSKKDVRACRALQDIIPPTDTINRHFLDLVRKLLAFDPEQRITVREALNHPYFSLSIPNEL